MMYNIDIQSDHSRMYFIYAQHNEYLWDDLEYDKYNHAYLPRYTIAVITLRET